MSQDSTPTNPPANSETDRASYPDSPLREAYRGHRPDCTPVWFMGQSVVHHPEAWDTWDLDAQMRYVLDPEVAVNTALEPVRSFDVDAALCFSDVLLPLRLVGVDLHSEGIKGVLRLPLRSATQIDHLVSLDLPDWPRVTAAVHEIRRLLPAEKVLIAIAATPFVMASLLVEGASAGGASLQTRIFMQSQPRSWEKLITWCANLIRGYATAQIEGGAEVLQMVDPWVHTLTAAENSCLAEPYARHVFDHFTEVTKVSCNLGAKHLIAGIAPHVDVVSIGDTLTFAEIAAQIPGKVLQGNLDPDLLYLPPEDLDREVLRVLQDGANAPAHVFNCAGALPTDLSPDEVRRLVNFIHNTRI